MAPWRERCGGLSRARCHGFRGVVGFAVTCDSQWTEESGLPAMLSVRSEIGAATGAGLNEGERSKMMKGKSSGFAASGIVMMAACAVAVMWAAPAAADFQVSSYQEFADIADQIESGDEVRFEAGTYSWGEEVLIGDADQDRRDDTDLMEGNPSNVTLSGGWNSSFTERTPGTTVISGQTSSPGGSPGWALVGFWGPEAVVDGFAFENNDVENSVVLFATGMPEEAGRPALTIRNCIIANNTSDWQLFLVDHGDFVMENNLVYGSSAAAEFARVGGRTGTDSAITLVNNIFHEVESGEGGEGTFLDLNGPLEVRNNIFSQNASASDGDGFEGNNVTYNLFHDNSNWGNAEGIAQGAAGNIFENPMFTNPGAGNFTLQSGSPALGAASDGGNLGASGLPGTADEAPDAQYVLQFGANAEDHVAIGTDGMGASGTIEAWWWLNNVEDKVYLFGHTTRPAFGSRIQIYNEGGGQGLSVGLGGSHALDQDIAALQAQTWHHVALVYDEGSYEVYLDGALVSSGSYEGLDEFGYAHIGNNASDGADQAPDGFIADARVWNTARSGSQIQSNMNRRLSGGEGGLVGYWPLNDGSGTTANDLSPQGNHGSIEGPQWAQVDDLPIDAAPAPGPQNVLYFDGDDSWVNLPHDIIPDWTQPWGVEAWVKPDNVGDRHTIINLRGGDEGSSIDFYLYIQDGVLGWYNGSHSDSFGSFETGQWSHVAVLFDGSEFQVYQDGDHLGSHSVSEGTSSHPDVGSTIGGNQRGPLTYEFDGMMADVRLWRGQVPSGGMIASRMNQRLTGDEAGLLGYWRFDEGSGTTAGDSSGNGNDGTLEGTVAWAESFDLPIDVALPEIPDLPPVPSSALWFDGENTWVEIPHTADHALESYTLSGWFFAEEDADDFKVVLAKDDGSSYRAWWVTVATGEHGTGEQGSLTFRATWEQDDSVSLDSAGLHVNDRTWRHMAAVIDPANEQALLYIDGELVDQGEFPGELDQPPATFYIGAEDEDFRLFEGMIAGVGLFDGPLSQSAIRAYMAEGLTGDEDALVGYWPLDEGEGDTAHDLTANENHGTIVSGEWVSETMPDLAGMHWEDAVAALEAEGFSVRIQYVQTGMVAAGQVLAQSPGAGQTSAPYWPVTIQVESEAESFAPAAPACFLLVVMTGVLAAAGYRMRRRVRAS